MDLSYIHSLARFGSKPGLQRIKALLKEMDNKEIPIIHIAGTNGKGSVAAMIAGGLTQAGYVTGLYTSPHLMAYEERFMLDGQPISALDLAELIAQIKPLVEDERLIREFGHATEFEVSTLIALAYFAKKADVLVLEVGLGGRLDATNVVVPQLAIITKIAMDHQNILGDTIEAIAQEKAGIIKQGCPVIMACQEPQARCVIEQAAQSQMAPLIQVGIDVTYDLVDWGPTGTYISYQGSFWQWDSVRINLLGAHQADNGACALAALEQLAIKNWDIPQEAVEKALDQVNWPGRLEIVQDNPMLLFDGAHNLDGARALAVSLKGLFPKRKPIFVMALLGEKEQALILDTLLPLGQGVVFTKPESSRTEPTDPKVLAQMAQKYGVKIWVEEDAYDAWRLAMGLAGKEDLVCVCGSLYLVGQLRRRWQENSPL